MEVNPSVRNISIYPVKSLDGIALQRAKIGIGGSLMHDREYAMFDANGKYINGKSNVLIHSLRSTFDLANETISLKHENETVWNLFHLQNDRVAINEFLSSFFKKPVILLQNKEGKFLDVPVNSGVTVLSTASLKKVSGWFENLELEETRKRFRATIEITNVPAFWEDHLFYEEENVVEFKIGDVLLYGMSPRARCVVPTRNTQSGEVIHAFAKSFANHRAENLPAWSALENYGHHYYLSVDCLIPETEFGKWIAVGDEINIIGKKIISFI